MAKGVNSGGEGNAREEKARVASIWEHVHVHINRTWWSSIRTTLPAACFTPPTPFCLFGFREKKERKKKTCRRVKARATSPPLAIPRVTSLPVAMPRNVSICKLGRNVCTRRVVGICTLATVVPVVVEIRLGEKKSWKRANLVVADPPTFRNEHRTSSSSCALNVVIKDRTGGLGPDYCMYSGSFFFLRKIESEARVPWLRRFIVNCFYVLLK